MKPFAKNIFTAFVIATAAFTFSSCDKDTLNGHGDDVTRTRSVGDFDKIEMGGEFEVYLTQGDKKDIILEGQENVLADIKTTTNNNKLEIEFRSRRVKISKPVRVYITTPTLQSLDFSGANSVHGLTNWNVADLDLKTSGSGNIDLTLIGADEVNSSISGSGEITLGGDANEHNIEISGSGSLKAFDLATKFASVDISGSGKCDLRVSEHIKANISGSGTVRYKGNPTIGTSISGSGKIEKWD